MIYLGKLEPITSKATQVCAEDVMDRAMTKPATQMMADLRDSRRLPKTLPGIATVTVK